MDKNRPLFEIMRESQQKKRLRLPDWMKRLADGADDPHPQAPRSEGGSAPSRRPHAARPVTSSTTAGPSTSPASATTNPAGTTTDQPSASPVQLVQWAKKPVGFRLPMGLLIALAVVIVALIVVVFLVALQIGRNRAAQQEQAYEAAAAPLRALQEQPPRPLIPGSVAGVEQSAALPPGKTMDASGTEATDPREPGLNYFRLTVLPETAREEALRAVAYLKANGVDATIVPVNNGGSLKLVALQGFARPLSDEAALRYKSQLQSLGRKWKAQHKGSSDWKDLFPEKYRPGVN